MKRILYVFMCFMLVLSACNKDLDNTDDVTSVTSDTETPRFYGSYYPEVSTTKATAQTTKLWNQNALITVKFLNGTTSQHAAVKKHAEIWMRYANVHISFVASGQPGDVRIRFGEGEDGRWVTWSAIGTDCRLITNQNLPTANIAFFDDLSPEEQKADVLRLFGQVLGLELEHRNLDFIPNWTSPAKTEIYWGSELEDIAWSELKKYVFDPLNASVTRHTDYDPESIMIWPFPKNVLRNTGTANLCLSEKDIEFISMLYPPILKIKKMRMNQTVNGYQIDAFTCRITHYGIRYWNGHCTLDGSAGITISEPVGYSEFYVLGWSETDYIHFYGDAESIRTLDLSGSLVAVGGSVVNNRELKELDASKLVNLKELTCPDVFLVSLKLPARPAGSPGLLYIGAAYRTPQIQAECAAKNWTIK